MSEFIVSVPKELVEEMQKVPDVDWKLVMKSAVKREVKEMLRLHEIVSRSRLTKKDVEELSEKIDSSLSKRFLIG